MSREVAVEEPHRLQMFAQQVEVARLLPGNADPVPVELIRHAVESPGDVQRQIDRVQLDMGQRMNQCGASLKGTDRPLRDLRRRHQRGSRTAARKRFAGQPAQVGYGDFMIVARARDTHDRPTFCSRAPQQQGVERKLAQVQGGVPGSVACGEATKP